MVIVARVLIPVESFTVIVPYDDTNNVNVDVLGRGHGVF